MFPSSTRFYLWLSLLLSVRANKVHAFSLQIPLASLFYDPTLDHAAAKISVRVGISLHQQVLNRSHGPSTVNKYLVSYLLTTSTDLEHGSSIQEEDSTSTSSSLERNLATIKFEHDQVVRVLDSNTVKLKRNGLVSFAAVQTPSGYSDKNFQFPECMTKSPAFKVRQILPSGTKVLVKLFDNNNSSSSSSRPKGALVMLEDKKVLVNTELVKGGFAKPISRGRAEYDKLLPGFSDYLIQLQKQAKQKGLGMYTKCEDVESAADDQFEPLDVTTEIQWGDDGGKIILKQKNSLKKTLQNPGDRRNCSDFETYEDALRWYEIFFPDFGDVAMLDRDYDGIPCSGLPHTSDPVRYRIKKPSTMSSL